MPYKTIRINSELSEQTENDVIKSINYNIFTFEKINLYTSLVRIEFYGINDIDAHFSELTLLLKNSNITNLSIKKCNFSNRDLLLNFIDHLKETNITYLNISNNKIDCEDLPQIFSKIKSSKVKILDVSSNHLISSMPNYLNNYIIKDILSSLASSLNCSDMEELYMKNMLHNDMKLFFINQLIGSTMSSIKSMFKNNVRVDTFIKGIFTKLIYSPNQYLKHLDLSCDDDLYGLHSRFHQDVTTRNNYKIYHLLDERNQNYQKHSFNELLDIMDEYIEMPTDIIGLIYDLSSNMLEIDI